MGGGNNNNSSNNTNWAEIQHEAYRVEREICMEGLRHDMECRGIKKGQLDALEQEKKNKKNRGIYISCINCQNNKYFQTVCNFFMVFDADQSVIMDIC